MACGQSNLVNFFKCEIPCRSISSSLSPTATIMYTGGTIRPVIEGSMAKVDAIGFHDGKVFAVGSLKYVKAKMESLGTSYNTVNLSTRQTLIPGMIEPHVHIVPGSITMNWNDFGPFDGGIFEGQYLQATYNLDSLKESITRAKSDLQASGDLERGGWILGYSADPSLMPFTVTLPANGRAVLISLDVDTVDSMENTTPVFMMSASCHTGYVNTPALQLIYNDNPDLHSTYPTFQNYRDHVNQGGGLQEIAEMMPAMNSIPEFQLNVNIVSNVDRYVDTALSRGATLLYDAAASDLSISIIDSYFSAHPKKIRIGYAKLCENSDNVANLPEYNSSTDEFKNNYQGSVKLVSDGSNQGLTGYQSEPYSCEPPQNYGAFNFPPFSQPDTLPDEFAEIVQGILDKGWPLMCHSNGDKAISLTLDAYEQALKGENGISKRHRIEHCSLLDSNALDRMQDLGISPSFLIGHVGYWGYVFKNAIFKDKPIPLISANQLLKKGCDFHCTPIAWFHHSVHCV